MSLYQKPEASEGQDGNYVVVCYKQPGWLYLGRETKNDVEFVRWIQRPSATEIKRKG